MSDKQKRRLAAVATILKKESHDLLSERLNLAKMLQVVEIHEAEVARVAAQIEDLEVRSRQLAGSGEFLSIAALDCARRYSLVAREQLREAELSRERSAASAEKTNQVVATQNARVRAIEKVHGRITSEQNVETERKMTMQMDDLWLQQQGKRT